MNICTELQSQIRAGGSFFVVPELHYHSHFLRASQLHIPLLKNRLVA